MPLMRRSGSITPEQGRGDPMAVLRDLGISDIFTWTTARHRQKMHTPALTRRVIFYF